VDTHARVVGPIARRTGKRRVEVDFGDLVRKLVVCEHFILESESFLELPLLVRKFGYDGVCQLFKSGLVEIFSEVAGIGFSPDGLTIGLHRIISLQGDEEEHMQHCFDLLREIPGLSARQARRLEATVAEALAGPARQPRGTALAKVHADVESGSPVVKAAIAQVLSRRGPVAIAPDDFSLTMAPTRYHGNVRGPVKYWTVLDAHTDLGEVLGLSPRETHNCVEAGLSVIGNLNERIELMERFDAVTGFQSSEVPLFDQKLDFLVRGLDPAVSEERLSRVVEIADLPDVDPDPDVHDVDLVRLVEIAQSEDAREFRNWLRGVDGMSDSEIRDQVGGLRDTVRTAIRSPSGRVVRFCVTAGMHLLPAVGLVAGPAAEAMDRFLLERLVSKPGPTAFVDHLYPSVFTRH
jgi:hypothetical protein